MTDLKKLINVEYKDANGDYPVYFEKISGGKVCVICDLNTLPYAKLICERIEKTGAKAALTLINEREPVPDEKMCDEALRGAKNCDFVLAVGSGTLSDTGKFVATELGIHGATFATAASMDGYCSKGSALMRGGVKVTLDVKMPEDILIDLDVIRSAPRIMTASGYGDIVGKYTCLTDWQLANLHNGEPVNEEAFSLMEQARGKCMDTYDGLVRGEATATDALMSALITAGLSMAICGNSRPASGSEHHLSHFLEMDFARRGEHIPLHGVKVAIGTLVSITIYNYINDMKIAFKGSEGLDALVKKLPTVSELEKKLVGIGCPVRYSQIGVRPETLKDCIANAYTVRNRFTVLTLANELQLNDKIVPLIMDRFY